MTKSADSVLCPYCGHTHNRVKDSRPVKIGRRRRRQCDSCGEGFTTIEITMEYFERINASAKLIDRFEKLRKEYR